MLVTLLVLLVFQAAPSSPAPVDVTTLTLGTAKLAMEVDTGQLKGDPVGLAWKADGTLYLRVSKSDAWGNQTASQYLVSTASLPATPTPTAQVPAWAADYWTWKSQLFAPGDPAFRIAVDSRPQNIRTTNTPNGGDIAGMSSAALPPSSTGGAGSGTTDSVAANTALNSWQSRVITMRVKGQVVGEWDGVPPQPGMRFGWAPAPMGVIAYVDSGKRLTLLDREGRKLQVPGATDVLLPAWSTDGRQIAYLQRKDKKHYSLMIIDVVVGR